MEAMAAVAVKVVKGCLKGRRGLHGEGGVAVVAVEERMADGDENTVVMAVVVAMVWWICGCGSVFVCYY